MRITTALMLVCFLLMPPKASQRPDFSGTWTLPPDAPPGANGKPATAPGFGATINIRHEVDTITISKILGGATVHVRHRLDGSESRSRTPGRLCEGDSESLWSASWQGDAVSTTLRGSRTAGASTDSRTEVKALFRLQTPDTLIIETTLPAAGGREPRTVTATYRKSGPPADVPGTPPAPQVHATIGQLEWLSGTWVGTAGTTTFEERWTPPAGGSMLAMSRTLRGGAMPAFEFLCIVERNGGLVYQAMPNGRQPATDFTLTKMAPSSVTFENPSHDFPKMIRYTLTPDGTLEAVISGTDAQKPQTFTFQKR
jgi:uncharacterized protein DUF6265